MIKIIKILELFTLGFIFPFSIVIFNFSQYILIVLWAVFIYALILYFVLYKRKVEFLNFFKFSLKEHKKYIFFIFIRWIIISVVLFFFTKYFFPEKLFFIQKNNQELLFKILFFYPIISAYPQEFIFCTFFFLRYSSLFIEDKKIIIMSAIIFCFSHIFALNFIAPLLSIFGGYFFASTYKKTKSLMIVSLEHALYGNTLFYLGLGWFFWGGSVGQ